MKAAHVTFGLYAATGIAAVIAAIYFARKGAELAGKAGSAIASGAAAVGDAINPTSSTNIVNRAVNGVLSPVLDVARGDPLGTNVDSLGTWMYSVLNPKDNAGAIASAPVYPTPKQTISITDYFYNVDQADLDARGAFAMDLGDYAATVADEDATLGAWFNGFQSDTAPAYLSYGGAFKQKVF